LNILIAPDKFKGSLTAEEVCEAIQLGISKNNPYANISTIPLADGGEGTCKLLTHFFGGSFVQVTVADPLFEPISSQYGISADGKTAFIEMAEASGLQLLPIEKRNPLYTTTYGTGEMLRHALDHGTRKIILGIGGSATIDAGMGMAEALGFEFYDDQKKRIKPIGASLLQLQSISVSRIHPRLKEVEIIALCDVENPLYGPQGAAYVYGPQKGADEKVVQLLDRGLQKFEQVIEKELGNKANFAGAGAGGGIGSGVKVFLNGEMRNGIDYVIEVTNLEEKIKAADVIITGEGKMDQQSLSGKVVQAVARLGKQFNKKIIAACGQSELTEEETQKMGISKVISLVDSSTNPDNAMTNAFALIQKKLAAEESFSI
jgi:glycerate 2-kinase